MYSKQNNTSRDTDTHILRLGMVVWAFDPSTWETEYERILTLSIARDQPRTIKKAHPVWAHAAKPENQSAVPGLTAGEN